MWTISALARIFPYATSIEILVATASATSFLSSAVMYLWGAVFIYPTILPVWSFCPRGVKTPSLFVAYFFRKNSNRFCGIYKIFIFSLVELLKFNRANLVSRWHEAQEKTKKTRTFTYRLRRETPKSERHLFA